MSCATYFTSGGTIGVVIFGNNPPMGKLSVLSKQIERDFSGVEFAAPATPEGARSRIMYLFDVRLNDGAGERDYSRVASGLSDHIARALKVNKYRPRLCKSREALRQKLFQGEE